jgi:hypothetical protein
VGGRGIFPLVKNWGVGVPRGFAIFLGYGGAPPPPPHTHTQAEDDPLSGVNDRPFVDPIEIKLWTPTNLRKEWVSKFAEEQGDPSPRPVQF